MNVYKLTGAEVTKVNTELDKYRKLYSEIITPLLSQIDDEYNNLDWWEKFSNSAGIFEWDNNKLHLKCRLLYPEAVLDEGTTYYSVSTLLGSLSLFDVDKYGFKLGILEALRGRRILHHKGTESYDVPLLTYFNYKSVLNGGWVKLEDFV